MKLLKRFRDWRRGYTRADLESLGAKLAQTRDPGGIVQLTEAELKALLHIAPAAGAALLLEVK